MTTKIYINGIAKETEKALCLIALVYYSANASREREIWMPKSVCKVVSEHEAEVASWFLVKASEQNAFKGYEMHFVELN